MEAIKKVPVVSKKGVVDTKILGVYEVNFSFILPLIYFFWLMVGWWFLVDGV